MSVTWIFHDINDSIRRHDEISEFSQRSAQKNTKTYKVHNSTISWVFQKLRLSTFKWKTTHTRRGDWRQRFNSPAPMLGFQDHSVWEPGARLPRFVAPQTFLHVHTATPLTACCLVTRLWRWTYWANRDWDLDRFRLNLHLLRLPPSPSVTRYREGMPCLMCGGQAPTTWDVAASGLEPRNEVADFTEGCDCIEVL